MRPIVENEEKIFESVPENVKNIVIKNF